MHALSCSPPPLPGNQRLRIGRRERKRPCVHRLGTRRRKNSRNLEFTEEKTTAIQKYHRTIRNIVTLILQLTTVFPHILPSSHPLHLEAATNHCREGKKQLLEAKSWMNRGPDEQAEALRGRCRQRGDGWGMEAEEWEETGPFVSLSHAQLSFLWR